MVLQTALYTRTLSELLPDVGLDESGIKVSNVQINSRKVKPGDLFFACKGLNADGRNFIEAAVESGASVVLAQKGPGYEEAFYIEKTPVIPVADLPRKISEIAGRFFARPAENMRLVGITGTNGKTTCNHILAQVMRQCLGPVGLIGTTGYGLVGQEKTTTEHTTPDPVAIQSALADLKARGAELATLEVSSHAISQYRVQGLGFELAMFTNLTVDHLDYHGDMASYGAAKQQLFMSDQLRYAVINVDDPFGEKILAEIPATVQGLSYSVSRNNADVYTKSYELTPKGMVADVVTPWGEFSLVSPLVGRFNLSNLLAVVAAAGLLGCNMPEVFEVIKVAVPAEGRMQRVTMRKSADTQAEPPFAVYVDYAHTPDALQNALGALQNHCAGKLWCVFGCGGDRDVGKRPQMGRVAEALADYVILTSDNPRGENPVQILSDIRAGLKDDCYAVIPDRAEAIRKAISEAQPGDCVLLAGKGHEKYQEVKGVKTPFDDVRQAESALLKRFSNEDDEVQP